MEGLQGRPAMSYKKKLVSPIVGDRMAVVKHHGINLREYYAGQILTGLVSSSTISTHLAQSREDIVERAVAMADLLIDELNK